MSRISCHKPGVGSFPLPSAKLSHRLRGFSIVQWCALIFSLFIAGGCIHTYPEAASPSDPTEISVDLLLEFSDEWGALKESAGSDNNSSGANRSEEWVKRLYISLRNKNGAVSAFTTTVTPDKISDGVCRVSIPSPLKAEAYSVAVWADYLHPSSLEPLAYDISNPALIRELLPRGEETDARNCFIAFKEFDLTPFSGKWNVSQEVSVTLSSPMTRIRLVATDYADFLSHTADARLHNEHYYVAVNYDSDIPGAFSLTEGKAMDPKAGSRFSAELPEIIMPGVEMCIGSDWLFSSPGRHEYTLSVSVFNSAQVIVSQTSGIKATAERGKITTVAGKLLTNFISGGITVDNIWDGVIEIEIP